MCGSVRVVHVTGRAASLCVWYMFKSTKRTSVTPLLSKLHWLPIAQRIEYTVSSICYSVAVGTAPAPPYISDLLELYHLSRSLRSTADSHTFKVPMMKKKSTGLCAFLHVGPCTWNKLPYSLRHSPSIPHLSLKFISKHHFIAQLILIHQPCVCVGEGGCMDRYSFCMRVCLHGLSFLFPCCPFL